MKTIINFNSQRTIPQDFPVPYAHTPSFVDSHITGYDNMMKGILLNLTEGKKTETTNGKINLIPGFKTYIGNLREVKRLATAMGANFTLLADNSDYLDSPTNGEFRMYQGGTPLADAAIAFQAYSTSKTLKITNSRLTTLY